MICYVMGEGGGVGSFKEHKQKKAKELKEKISEINAYLKKLENINSKEAYEESQNLRKVKAIYQAQLLHLEDEYANGGSVGEMTRDEIEDKIEGLKLRLAKEKKRISTYETTERGKYNKLWQEKIVPLQKELDSLSELWGKSKYANGGGVDGKDLFSMSKTIMENGKIVEMVIAENVSVKEFNKLFADTGYRKVDDSSLVGFYFVKPNGDTIQLIPSFHKKGEVIKYENGGGVGELKLYKWQRKEGWESILKKGFEFDESYERYSDLIDELKDNFSDFPKVKGFFKSHFTENGVSSGMIVASDIGEAIEIQKLADKSFYGHNFIFENGKLIDEELY